MKILFVNKYFHPRGGPETLLFNSLEKMQSLGHTVITFSMQRPLNLETEYKKYFVSNVDYNHHSAMPWNLAKTALRTIFNLEAKKKIERLIEDTKPDIAHLHNIYHQLSPSILLPLKKHKIPVVMTLHDFKLVCPNYTFLRGNNVCEECQGKHFYKTIKYRCVKGSFSKSLICAIEMYLHHVSKLYIRNIDCFMAVSKFSFDKFIQYGVPPGKLILLPPPVDRVKNKTSSRENGKYVLFFGRLSDRNGIPTLLKAMNRLPDVQLKIAGDGELRKYIEREKPENVSCLGFIPRNQLKKIIEYSSFTVFPNHCFHLCPFSILESFSYSKPVIGSNLGSVPELIEDGINGLLFEPKNVDELAEKIKYLYRHPLLAEKMGIAAREKVEEKYSEEEYYKKLLGLYDSLIKNGGTKNV